MVFVLLCSLLIQRRQHLEAGYIVPAREGLAIQDTPAQLARRTTAQWGDAACFSLGRGKLVSGGEGGLLATDDANLYERALSLTQHPTRIKRELGPESEGFDAEDLGYNYRMHPLAAVLALADVANLDQRLSHRRNVWRAFHEGLREVPFL